MFIATAAAGGVLCDSHICIKLLLFCPCVRICVCLLFVVNNLVCCACFYLTASPVVVVVAVFFAVT